MKNLPIISVASAIAAMMAIPAYAQTQPNDDDQSAEAVATTGGITDIVVTAQRRSESSQRAAVAIDVIGGADMARAGITRPEQLGQIAPALIISPSTGGRTSFFLRGVGNFTATPAFDSAIAFNYDGVYIGKPGGTSGFFYDLERVEVLVGPQGTLYGRNATGGAINVLPVKPKHGEFSGYATGTYGNYDAYSLEGAINVPMGENGALRVSGNRVKRDGYLTDGTSADDSAAFRAQMSAELTPNFTARVGFDYSQVRGLSSGAYYAGAYNNAGTYVPSGFDPSVGLFDPRAQAYRQTLFLMPAARFALPLDALPTVHSNNYGANAELTWSSDAGTLIFIPAWRRNETVDFNSQLGAGILVENTNDQQSYELRFVGNKTGMFDYQIGAIYIKEDSKFHFGVNQQTLYNQQDFTQGTESYAGFARVTAHLTDSFRVVGAARYTKDKKYYDSEGGTLAIACTTFPPTPCSNVPLFPSVRSIADMPSVFPIPPATGGALPIFVNGVPTGAIVSRRPDIIRNENYSASKLTYRAAVEFDVGPQSLMYASIETGFRSGGLQQADGFETYAPENITAYTVGSKNRFFGNSLQLNIEGFYWKYKDQQLTSITLDINGRQGNFTKNIGSSTNYGFDVDVIYLPMPTTRLAAKVQYLNATYDRFVYSAQAAPAPVTSCPVTTTPGTPATGTTPATPPLATVNCSGYQAFNAPKWTLNLGVDQTINLNDYKLVLSANTQYRSSRWVGFEYQQGMLQAGSWTSNAQIEFAPQDDNWSIAAYVRNIENDRIAVNALYFSFGRALNIIPSAPRTYGVRATVKF